MSRLVSVVLLCALLGPAAAQAINLQSLRDRLELQTIESLIKKKIPDPDPAPELENLKRILDSLGAIANQQGILIFKSNEHVIAALNYIGALEAKFNYDWFIRTKGGESDPGMDFNDQQPYEQFERQYNFASLRSIIAPRAKEYLRANKTDDVSQDPDNHFIAEYAIRTIVNPYAELGIGSEFFRLTPDGYQRYPNLDALFKSRDIIIANTANAFGRRLQAAVTCFGTRVRTGVVTTGTRRIRWVIGIFWLPWTHKAFAQTYNFRRVFWIWWPAFSWTFARIYGQVSADKWGKGCMLYREQCLAATDINMDFACYKYQWALFVTHTLDVYHKTGCNWLRGHHWGIATVGVPSSLC